LAVVWLVLVATACTGDGSPASAPLPSASASSTAVLSRDEGWTEDIQFLVDQMRSLHPDLFHGVAEPAFDAAIDDLLTELPRLNDDEVLVGVMHLVAMISSHGRDGHMGVWPPDNPDAVHRFPIRVWEFPEGLFITGARQPNGDLVGSRIVSVEGVPIRDVFRRLDPVVPRDSPSNLRAARSVFLTSAEVLAGLGIADDPLRMVLEVEGPDGRRRTATVDVIDAGTYAEWIGGWELLLPAREDVLFLQDAAAPYLVEYLAPTRTLYVQYNVVREHSSQVVAAITQAMRGHPVDRMVLDLRSNGGGEAGGYRELLRFLGRSEFDPPGRLAVLIGRLTFSAGVSLASRLREQTQAAFLGEDSGGAPQFFANPDTITLPNSGLRALVATGSFGHPDDPRLTLEPDIAVPYTSTDYFAGVDPVLEAALRP
jgi:hypothetical protein